MNTTLPTITVDIDGQAHNIDDLSWGIVAPCGCISGVHVTRIYGKNFKVIGYRMTEEAAWEDIEPHAGIRQQEIDRGVTVKLITRETFDAAFKADCPHDPKWGRQLIPEGTQWGRSHSGRIVHLVDDTEGESMSDRHKHREPKCGAKLNLYFIDRIVTSEAPKCKKCLDYAKAVQA